MQGHSQSASASSAYPSTSGNTSHRRSRARKANDSITFSQQSSPSVRNSFWFCSDFMVGAGMVVLQPATGKVLLLYEPRNDRWLLPKGRKDVDESLEQTALREAYEEVRCVFSIHAENPTESACMCWFISRSSALPRPGATVWEQSGYRVEFLPLYLPTNAPLSPAGRVHGMRKCTEPFYASTLTWGNRNKQRPNDEVWPGDRGGEYITFWYIGQIPRDAVHEADTGMADEKEYQSHLLELDDACEKLRGCEMLQFSRMVKSAHELWLHTKEFEEKEAQADAAEQESMSLGA
ncbi:uncharacterized protein C8Q71DRAFT_557804 [Rhodofomes roseus]|uniref:Nudix hydrolase domain-containing protein n=1 Tax=Rhodofomes roseus TaxID=34475 RepID=A0ABQ8KIC0_9APHY|nr:uncharacterized protein C8Q71DRAFT_557804 [Rhodofomes roseus]KAH9837718.1 hypothetical protein C8Q71DRAFT_557804 [Rhodofomes roseus]